MSTIKELPKITKQIAKETNLTISNLQMRVSSSSDFIQIYVHNNIYYLFSFRLNYFGGVYRVEIGVQNKELKQFIYKEDYKTPVLHKLITDKDIINAFEESKNKYNITRFINEFSKHSRTVFELFPDQFHEINMKVN